MAQRERERRIPAKKAQIHKDDYVCSERTFLQRAKGTLHEGKRHQMGIFWNIYVTVKMEERLPPKTLVRPSLPSETGPHSLTKSCAFDSVRSMRSPHHVAKDQLRWRYCCSQGTSQGQEGLPRLERLASCMRHSHCRPSL